MARPATQRNRALLKRTHRNLSKAAVGELTDADSDAHLMEAEFRLKLSSALKVVSLAAVADPGEAGRLMRTLQLCQSRRLEEYSDELSRRSRFLNAGECWAFLQDRLSESRRYGIEEEFRHLVFQAAGEFANTLMLRLTQKYSTMQ